MFMVIRRYEELDPSSVEEVLRHIDEGFTPIIKDAPGFLAYYTLDTGGREIATISIFEDRDGAEESIRLAADYILKQNLAPLLPNPPEVIAGEVRTQELNLVKLGIRKVSE